MTTFASIQGERYKTVGAITTDTNPLTVLTCPDTYLALFITMIVISDDVADARTATVAWTDSSASATIIIRSAAAIAANTALEIEFHPLVLEPGDSLSVTGSASGMHITVSYAEVVRTSYGRA